MSVAQVSDLDSEKNNNESIDISYDMDLSQENLFSGFPKKCDSNQPAELQRLARKLKFPS